MPIKTIASDQWCDMTTVGFVVHDGRHIIATPHPKHRSEVKLQQCELSSQYRYSFRLSGEFQQASCIVLQFHDWWGDRFQKIYAATSPPICFSVRGNRLCLSVNELVSPPEWSDDGTHLTVESHRTECDLQELQLDEWTDLIISVGWSRIRNGYVLCNGRGLVGFRTMFNSNPCDIQAGLYGRCQFTSNTIRELSC